MKKLHTVLLAMLVIGAGVILPVAPASAVAALEIVTMEPTAGTVRSQFTGRIEMSGLNTAVATTLTVDGDPVVISVTGGNTVQLTWPVHAVGVAEVVISNDSRSVTTEFEYLDVDVSPLTGTTETNNEFIITASGFTSDTGVSLDGFYGCTVEVLSATQIRVITPFVDLGNHNIYVYTPGRTLLAGTYKILPSFESAPVPTVSGSLKVGATLTAEPGNWLPTPTQFSYQWWIDGEPVIGGDDATFVLPPVALGKSVAVAVTASKDGYATETVDSVESAAVQAGTIIKGTPTITGVAKVGSVLTADPGVWTPADTDLTYRWKRDGAYIAGAGQITYTPTAADLGKTLTVTVFGTRAGYTAGQRTSAATAVVASGSLGVATPTISGTAVVGSVLTANPGTWSPAGVTFLYSWRRDGVAISGAIKSTYTLTNADAGSKITVTVKGSKTGYTPVYKSSAATATVTGGKITAGTVTITGTATVGKTLTATSSGWAPAGLNLAYAWKRDGVKITGATASTYKLVAADKGATITVVVGAMKTGFTSKYVTSAGVKVS